MKGTEGGMKRYRGGHEKVQRAFPVAYHDVFSVQMKNWEPLVLGPQFAIERVPGAVCFSLKFSSGNVSPYMDLPPVPKNSGGVVTHLYGLLEPQPSTPVDNIFNILSLKRSFMLCHCTDFCCLLYSSYTYGLHHSGLILHPQLQPSTFPA